MRSLAASVAIGVFAAGCGGGGKSQPKPISGTARQVAAVVERLGKATAQRDFTTVCDDLLAASTRKQAGGDQCSAVLAARVRDVRHPRIKIQAIAIQGRRAQVRVRTTADGQDPTTDVIRLIEQNGAFKVVSLGR